MRALQWIHLIWYLLAAIWLGAAFFSKKTVRRQSQRSTWLQAILTAGGFVLLFDPYLRVGVLGWHLVPVATAANMLGIALAIAGCLLTLWARLTLGRNWSGVVTLKQDHVLITRGPYRWVRHPIYSGILLLVLGTAVVVGVLASFVALVLIFLGLWMKSRVEEDFMQQEFGEQYLAYQRRVKAIVPGVL